MPDAVCLEPGVSDLSATRIHDIAVESFRMGNHGHLALCCALRVIDDHRLYFELGYPNVAAYAGAQFDMQRSEAYEALRVARALDALKAVRDAFAEGHVGWSKVKAITRIA